MNELEDRLIRCFDLVFHGLNPNQIRGASVQTLPAWDSLASATLVAVLEQEFNVQIDPLDLPELTSFLSAQAYISDKLNDAAGAN
ncbi:MAG: acyl carrier protein [Terriglobales bacterium]|jgi:acyl carrier protein